MAPPKLNRKCSVEGCENRHSAHGYCATHHRRWKLYGSPHACQVHQVHGASLLERWNAYAGDRGSGCWEWTGHRDPNGYGRLNVGNRPVLAHRIAWELFRGPITTADHICHRCDNPSCVRPEHLFKGDHTLNMADKMAKKRHRYGVSRGSAHGCAKLTEEAVREIRASTLKLRELAERYGISISQVSDIRRRKTWKHLP
jgi:hypothetical protein